MWFDRRFVPVVLFVWRSDLRARIDAGMDGNHYVSDAGGLYPSEERDRTVLS